MKKNVASQKIGAQMVSATDGSAFTSAVTVYVTLDAGTQAIGSVGSGACTHEGNGYHTYAPAQAETNGDLAAFTFIGTGAVPATVQIYTFFPQTVDNATNITAIKAKTDNLPTDPADASDITASFATVNTGIADLPTNAELATALGTSDDAVLARLGTPAGASVSADILAIKTETAAILDDTSNIATEVEIAAGVLAAAEADPIHANIERVNDVVIIGTGETGDTWGPA